VNTSFYSLLPIGHRHEDQRQRHRIRVRIARRLHVHLAWVLGGHLPSQGRRPEPRQPRRIESVDHEMDQASRHAATLPSRLEAVH
jgi:hypothetical protein